MARTKPQAIRLYIVEEQETYREVYKSAFSSGVPKAPFDLLGICTNSDLTSIREVVATLNPDVLLVGTKNLSMNVVAELERVRVGNPRIAIVLLLVRYEIESIQSLRRTALKGEGGMALFLKQSLDQVEQLRGIILAANHGQVILDPALAGLLFTEKSSDSFLKQLTARESEILSLLSEGYTNAAIAQVLYIDVKTVEHHINSMYGKLKAEADFNRKHPRVSAARLYLEATGELVCPAMPIGTAASLSHPNR